MKFDNVKIVCAGLAAHGTKILVNGEEVEDCVGYSLSGEVNGITTLTLTVFARNVEVEGQAEVAAEIDLKEKR